MCTVSLLESREWRYIKAMNNNNHCSVILTDIGLVITVQPYLLTHVLSSLSSHTYWHRSCHHCPASCQGDRNRWSRRLCFCTCGNTCGYPNCIRLCLWRYKHTSVLLFNWYELFLTHSLYSSSYLRRGQRERPERGNMGETETRETEGYAIQIGRQTDTYKQ